MNMSVPQTNSKKMKNPVNNHDRDRSKPGTPQQES